MNENPEESIRSTDPKFPGYAQRQEEDQWLVFRSNGAQVGFIFATSSPEMFEVASVPRGLSGKTTRFEVGSFQDALAYCLKNFRPNPI